MRPSKCRSAGAELLHEERCKVIRDPLYGWIYLTEREVRLIDSSLFIQRLKYVHQLGPVYQVYPSARHTRFEHSIGVLHIASMYAYEVLKRLVRDDVERVKRILELFDLRDLSLNDGVQELVKIVRVAALLHDIGHLPLSHSIEGSFSQMILTMSGALNLSEEDVDRLKTIACNLSVAKEHEWIAYMNLTYNRDLTRTLELIFGKNYVRLVKLVLFANMYRWLLETGSADVIARDVEGLSKSDLDSLKLLSSVISGDLDADRIDYILRDLYFTGASPSASLTPDDVRRMIYSIRIKNGVVTFDERAKTCLEGFTIARYSLYRWVYLHHKVVLMTVLMSELLRRIILSIDKILDVDDVLDLVNSMTRFALGDIPEQQVLKVTDYYLYSVLIRSSDVLRDRLGDDFSIMLESAICRCPAFKSMWKRDVEYMSVLAKHGVSDVTSFNKLVDKVAREWSRSYSSAIKFDEIFRSYLKRELLRCSANDEECIHDIVEYVARGGSLAVIGFTRFDAEMKVYVLSNGNVFELSEVSPLARSIRDSWMRSPHLFIYVNNHVLSRLCKDRTDVVSCIRSCIVKAFVDSVHECLNELSSRGLGE